MPNKAFVCLCLTLFASVTFGQVVVTPLKRDGWLRWTNHVGSPLPFPIYRVESSADPSRAWRFVAAVTNAVSINLSNHLPITSTTNVFYRIAWSNGQVWSIAMGGGGLSVTGNLHLASSFNSGTWYLTNSNGGTAFRFTGKGTLASVPFIEPGNVRLEFGREVLDYSDFWLEGSWPPNNPWQGTWHERGIIFERSGTFIAVRDR